MKRSGLSAICMIFATDYQQGDAYGRFLKGFASMDRQLKGNSMKCSFTPVDVRAAHDNRHPTVIQALEDAAAHASANAPTWHGRIKQPVSTTSLSTQC